MSKLLKEVTAHKFQVSFLGTIQPEPCNVKGTMDIIVEELNDDGSPWTKQAVRFVKVCHSQNECTHYEIAIDKTTGIGRITLESMEAMNYVIAQVDECGNQMITGDDYDIHYLVNEDMMEEDYASVSLLDTPHARIHIINRRMQKARLDMNKVIRHQDGSVCEMPHEEEFLIRITKGDCFERFVKLNECNDFHASLEDLRAGVYTIEEYEYCDYTTYYKFNGAVESTNPIVTLLPGDNTLQIINEKRLNTQLTIEKYVRNACGELCKPSCFEEFEVQVISQEYEEYVVLCEENDFCTTLYGILPGVYEVHEMNSDRMQETSYIVNDGEEMEHALVEVCEKSCAMVWVVNSNNRNEQPQQNESALRICKYIRRCDGCIVRPDECEQFKVMVCGCGINETFYLNSFNNFCVDMASLCIGDYEIKEVSCGDYMTSYSINGERERTSACIHYDGCQTFCVSIINEERNRGSIRVTKYIQNEFGDLIKPNKEQCFSITLSSYFCKHCFELSEENDFTMCFHDLRFGSYEIREEDVCDYETSYQINCEREKRHARFTIDDCYDNDIKIINRVKRSNCGILKISKFIESASKELVKPSRDEEFSVEVEGPCFCERYVLRAGNNWNIQLEGLGEGEYQIRECDGNCYDVSYVVNKEYCQEAIVYMGECNQEVCIINHFSNSGDLTISSCVRTCDGEMMKPHGGISFEILVEGSDDCLHVCLNADNNWCAVLDDLCEGKYRIIQKDNMGYKVSYFVHGREESFGKIRLGNQDEEVIIINEETPCMGNVIVTKYIQDEEGNLTMPCPQDEFHFELIGQCFTRTYTLRKRNDFCIYFDDLEEGAYELCELDEGYDVTYQINGECVDRACFTLGREDVHVDIINALPQEGMVRIEKCIRKGNTLVKPCGDACYQILLKGKNCHEVYELSEENDFCITLCNMNKQHYEVKELTNDCHVSYDVDGHIQEDGYFLFDGENIAITVINEEKMYGCMELCKVLVGEDGNIYRPGRYDCFEVLVESDCYKQKVILNHDNDFCVKLYDLPQAHYEVCELDHECCVSYLINDLPYESACVDVCEEDVCITIMNHPCHKGSFTFQGFIEEQGCIKEASCEDSFCIQIIGDKTCEQVVLNEQNKFCEEVVNLLPGSYKLSETGCEAIQFEMENQVFDDEVCVELNGEDVCVNVIRHITRGVNITIQACDMDACGNVYQGDAATSYDVQLISEEGCHTYTLNQKNQFTQVVCMQKPGAYEIKECGCDTARFQINDTCIQQHGHFHVGTQDVCVMVINQGKCSAYLHVEARIKDCDERRIRPCDDMCFEVDITSDCVKEHVVLNAKNHWHTKVLLEEGCYDVVQRPNAEFVDVAYLVNDKECAYAHVELYEEDQYVTSINQMNCARGSIEICKLIRDDEGCYCYPNKEDAYWIQIKSATDNKRILLNSDNHFYASLRGLNDGWYEVMEEMGSDGVEYVVNNAAVSARGMVHVCGNANTVNIINPLHPTPIGGSIELNKYIMSDDGGTSRPSSGTYRIHVSKPGYNEIFYLDAENGYHMIINELEDGLYVVDEVDHEGVTYIVNGGSVVDRASVRVQGTANQVDIFNLENQPQQGSITLAKYIRENGRLQRPTNDASFVFLVSRPGFNELYTLDQSNQWMYTIENLEDGDYVVSETTTYDGVSYIINGGSEVDRGIVQVQNNRNTVQIINTASMHMGSIHIEKYIREDMKLRRPTGDFVANIFISKPGYNETFTLDQTNNWMLDITQLENGLYVIDEIDSNDEVTYIINGGSEVRNGVVSVENNNAMVMMIDTMNEQSASITIEKFIRQSDGTLDLPSVTQSFQVEVRGDDQYQNNLTLSQMNQWKVMLNNLNNGYYEIIETSNQGYSTSYIVDDGLETGNASVRLLDNAHRVQIINSTGEMMGRLEITKFIKNADGSVMQPADGDIYFVEISNANTLRKIQLDSGNGFQSVIQDLPQGDYQVRETNAAQYLTTYRVNGGPEETIAVVSMASGINNTIAILNELRGNRNVIEVFKYMLDNDGNYLPPTAPDVYFFTISGLNNTVSETYELNVDNSWNQSLRTLPSGMYQIKEIGTSPYPVKYIINSADLKEEAIFQAQPGSTSVIGIINQIGTSDVGELTISKRIKDSSGNLSIPTSGEVFTVNVTGNNQNEIVTLDAENNYSFTIFNLAFSSYTIEEVSNSNYTTTYRINEGMETSRGVVDVNSTATNVALVINTPNLNTNNVMKRRDTTVRVVIE